MPPRTGTIPKQKPEEICPRCGGRKRTMRPGSLTGWIFAPTACKCIEGGNLSMPEIVTSGRTAQDTGELVEIGSGYEVLELIGKGGMASVYKVRDTNTGKSRVLT
jgi:hypothetical protein